MPNPNSAYLFCSKCAKSIRAFERSSAWAHASKFQALGTMQFLAQDKNSRSLSIWALFPKGDYFISYHGRLAIVDMGCANLHFEYLMRALKRWLDKIAVGQTGVGSCPPPGPSPIASAFGDTDGEIFDRKICWPKIVFGRKHFRPKMLSIEKCFSRKKIRSKICLAEKINRPNLFSVEKVFSRKFVRSKTFLDEKIFGRKVFRPKTVSIEMFFDRKNVRPKNSYPGGKTPLNILNV